MASLQHRLQHSFRKPELLQRALTHRSFSSDHYERLEFLGDSVLGLVMSDMLYQQLQQLPEGDLSRVRANLVREETLHKLALGLELPTLLRLGEGEMRSGGARRASILADALEAIIGAVYVDAGFDAAHAVVKHLFAKVEFTTSMTARDKDPKTALQEWLQGRKYRLPVYTIVATTGLAHQQNFDVECVVPDLRLTERGLGASRRAAEQAAAAAMLQTIQARNKT
nr:ribonuclease III [Curvibacter sp. CHRR-16]